VPLKAGETLIWEGDGAENTYVVTRGALRASKSSDDGRRQILDFMFAGQFVGIPSDAAYHFNVEALTDAEVCRFDRRKLEQVMAKYPGLERGYRTGTARQLEQAYEHAYALGRRTAMERVAAFLLDLRASSCPKTSTGVLKLPMTRGDIADFLGLTLETVSRAFSRLKSLGVVRLPSAQEVEIRDAERLRALAGAGGL
jgi:CRP/FNR family transcriptional regulator